MNMKENNDSKKQTVEVKTVGDDRKAIDFTSRIIAIFGLIIAIISCGFSVATYYRTFVDENIVIADFDTDLYFSYENGEIYLPVEITFTNNSAQSIPLNDLSIDVSNLIGNGKHWYYSQALVNNEDDDVTPININANTSFKGSYRLRFTLLPNSSTTVSQMYEDGQKIKIIDFLGAATHKKYAFQIKAITGKGKELNMLCEKEYNVVDYIASIEMNSQLVQDD